MDLSHLHKCNHINKLLIKPITEEIIKKNEVGMIQLLNNLVVMMVVLVIIMLVEKRAVTGPMLV
jgi:hypothetical protein